MACVEVSAAEKWCGFGVVEVDDNMRLKSYVEPRQRFDRIGAIAGRVRASMGISISTRTSWRKSSAMPTSMSHRLARPTAVPATGATSIRSTATGPRTRSCSIRRSLQDAPVLHRVVVDSRCHIPDNTTLDSRTLGRSDLFDVSPAVATAARAAVNQSPSVTRIEPD